MAGILLATAGQPNRLSRPDHLRVSDAGLLLRAAVSQRAGRRCARRRPPNRCSKACISSAKNKLILSAISLDLFAVLFGGATALLPIYAADILHAGARGLGWLRAAPSVGSVTMALVLAHSPKIHRAGKALLWAVAGFGAATIVFGLSRSLWLSLAMLVLVGAFDNVSVVLRQSLLQTKTPDYVRGRVLAFSSIFISSSNQFGAVESGWTAAWFGAVGSVAGGGLATIAVVLICAAVSVPLRRWKQ